MLELSLDPPTDECLECRVCGLLYPFDSRDPDAIVSCPRCHPRTERCEWCYRLTVLPEVDDDAHAFCSADCHRCADQDRARRTP